MEPRTICDQKNKGHVLQIKSSDLRGMGSEVSCLDGNLQDSLHMTMPAIAYAAQIWAEDTHMAKAIKLLDSRPG